MIGLQNYFSTLRHLEMLKKYPEILIDKPTTKLITQYNNQLDWMKRAHIFHVDEDTTKLLLLTKNKVRFMQLPFNNMFIDCALPFGRLRIEGIHIIACKPLDGTKFTVTEDGDYSNFHFFYFIGDAQRPDAKYFEYGMIETSDELETKFKEDVKKRSEEEEIDFGEAMNAGKNVKVFLMNFLSLLDNPEVEIVERKADEARNEKRAMQNKFPIPTRRFVTVTGTIKEYIGQLRAGKHFSYGVRFWVRGHFRTFADERYKAAQGKKKWIMPFVKGCGLLVSNPYIVKKGGMKNDS